MILDTNILSDIILKNNYNDLLTVLENWIENVSKRMNCKHKERDVTIIATKSLLNDYMTGLNHCGFKQVTKTLDYVFDSSLTLKRRLPINNGVYFTIRKMTIINSQSDKKIMRDKYDKKLWLLAHQILKVNKWNDRAIIIATRDSTSSSDIDAELIRSGFKNKYNMVDDIDELENLIIC